MPPASAGAPRLSLLIAGPLGGGSYPLPASGTVTIGRAEDCQITLDDPLVSRRHAALHVGAGLAVEDLGSANGTIVGGRKIKPETPIPVELEAPISVGSATLVVRAATLVPGAGDCVLPPAAFADELRRRSSGHYVVARIRLRRSLDLAWIAGMLQTTLRSSDRLGPVGPEEFFVLRSVDDGAPALVAACLSALSSWRLAATGESRAFGPGPVAAQEALAYVTGGGAMQLERGPVIFRDPAMMEVRSVVDRVAPTVVNVLLLGPTGVGKDVIASLVHETSPRAAAPFVRINCAALSEALLESELFGHEKGAFTGAAAAKPGLLESASGGTVFLDEIGEMPLSLQAKLLRAIDSKEITRVGGLRPRGIDVRFIAATNRDLHTEAQAGAFRQDLLFRLDGLSIRIPPLRDRPADVEALATHFLESAAERFRRGPVAFAPDAVEVLRSYAWPGNVRELRNIVERAVLLTNGPLVGPADLGLPGRPAPAVSVAPGAVPAGDREEDERAAIIDALDRCAGNQSRAADLLGMPRRTLVRKLARYGVPRPRVGRRSHEGPEAEPEDDV